MSRKAAAGHGSVGAAGWAAVMVLAAAFRLINLGGPELWYDEVATVLFAEQPIADIFGWLAAAETNPPVYFAAMHLWLRIAGDGEAALRLPSALAGIAAVAATMRLASLSFGPRAGLWAGLVLAVAAWHVMQSRDARAYVFLALFFALALLAARRVADLAGERPAAAAWPAAALALLGGAMSAMHYTGILAAATAHAYGLFLLILRRDLRIAGLAALGAAGAMCLLVSTPLLMTAFGLAADPANAVSWMHESRWARMGQSLQAHLLATPVFLLGDPGLRSAIALGGGVFTLWLVVRLTRMREGRGEMLALAGLVGTAAMLFLAVEAVSPVMLGRTLAFLQVPLAILIGAALAGLASPLPRLGAFAAHAAIQAPMVAACFEPPWNRQGSDLAAELASTHATVVVTNILDAATVERYGRNPAADYLVPTAIGHDLQRRLVAARGQPPIVAAAHVARLACGAEGAAAPLRTVESLKGDGLRAALHGAGWTIAGIRAIGVYAVETWNPPACATTGMR